MKEQEKKQSRVLLAPIVAYMLVGYGLLFSVYKLETLVSRLLRYCRFFRPFEFTVTAWHEDTLWVNIAFPLTWPILTLRALLLVIVAFTFAGMERFFNILHNVLQGLQHLMDVVVSMVWQALIQLATVIRRGFVTVALFLRDWIWELIRLIRTGFASVWKHALAISKHLLKITTPTILAIKQVILSPFRWLWFGFISIGAMVKVWFLAFVKMVWREMVTAGIWLWTGFRYLGRQTVMAIQIGRRWIVVAAITTWQYLLVPLRWLRIVLVEIIRELLTILRFCLRWLMIGLQTIWGWLIVIIRWIWTGLIAIQQHVVFIARLIWSWLEAGFRTIWLWLLVPLQWVWTGWIHISKELLRVARFFWRWSWAGLCWLGSGLVHLWRQAVATLNLIWLWLLTSMSNVWLWIRAPLLHLWSSLLFIWNLLSTVLVTAWRGLNFVVKWVWFSSIHIWRMFVRFYQAIWQVAQKMANKIGGWLLGRIHWLWQGINWVWNHIKGLATMVWQWLITVNHFVWSQATALIKLIGKPIRIIWTNISYLVRVTWSRLADLGKVIWEQIRLPVKAGRIWLNRIWEITKIEVHAIWRRLWRSTGFWKRIATNLQASRAQLMLSLSATKASMSKRLHNSREQLTVGMAGLRNQARRVIGEVRLWMAELRDQTAEVLRSIVPHG